MSKQKQRADRIAKLQGSPAEFRNALVIEANGGPVRLGDVLDPWQRRDFEYLDPAWFLVAHRRGEPSHRRAWLERPRGHSKTQDLAVMVSWCLFSSPRRLEGLAAAADRDQARLLRDKISSLVATNPWLSRYLDVQQYRVLNPRTESTLEIISSDAPTSYGATPDFIIADEVTHWPKRDLFDSLISSAAKREHCLFLTICNAGFQDSWQASVRESISEGSGWYFRSLDGPCASWISQELLDEQKSLLPRIAFERLWLNRWGSGQGDAIDPDDLTAAIHTKPAERDPSEWMWCAGVDLGLKRDASAVVTVGCHVGQVKTIHKERPARRNPLDVAFDAGLLDVDEYTPPLDDDVEYKYVDATGRLAVADIELWQPAKGDRVNLTEIEETILRLHDKYNFASIACDPWQAAMLMERLRAAGLPVEPVDFVGSNLQGMASAVLEAFREQNIDLPDHAQLIADLKRLKITEKSYGVRLESPRTAGGHGDAATALSLALLAVKRTASAPPPRIDGPLVCWP